MKLTEEQTDLIGQQISFAVKYLETYDEVYDHVITTLEHTPGCYIDDTFDAVMQHEFGGIEALKRMEKQRLQLIYKVMRHKHWLHIIQFFNWPLMAFTIGITIAAYFIALNPLNCKYLFAFTYIGSCLPLLYIAAQKLITRYKGWYFDIYPKPSIKTNYVFNAAMLGMNAFNVLNFCIGNKRILTSDWVIAGPITMLLFVMYAVYVISFFKLYQDEFKMRLAI